MAQQIKKYNIIKQVWMKFLRCLVADFPANKIRVWALRQCGFQIGRHVYIGPGLLLSTMNSENSCHLVIEDRVSIGPRVTLVLASDPNHSTLIRYFPPVRGKIHLKNDVWLGAGVIVLPNVTIGENAAIAAGAVVTKNIDPYTLSGGVPAKLLKKLKED